MEKQTIKKSYWAVTPATVRYDRSLPDGAKLLYGEISALCNERGYCWASNLYFSELYGNDARTISRWISALSKQEHVYVKVIGKVRKIFLTQNFDVEDLQAETEQPAAVESKQKKKTKAAKKVRKPIEKKYTEDDMRLAELLLQKILLNFPVFENKKIKLEEWADDVRKLREIDKASPGQIRFMITWVHGGEITNPGQPVKRFEPHDFWARNILSAKKLRKQWFDNLVPQLQAEFKKDVKKNMTADLSANGAGQSKKTHQVVQL